MRQYILLTPGPLTTSENVKETMLRDWCTWDDDYNVGVVQKIREKLVALATHKKDEYTAVLLQGSGTFAVEGTLISSVSKNDKLLIATNGAYGDRMAQIAQRSGLNYQVLAFPETEIISPDELDFFLSENKDITHVAFVHCETTTGILNQLEELAEVVKKRNKVLLVDAMSSFGGIPFDVSDLGIDFLVSSANKCIQGVPGFAFVIARKDSLKQCKGKSPSLSLDIYDQWETMEKHHGKWRFTSPTHVVRAFNQALDELEKEGGIEARHNRYCLNHRILIEGMVEAGYSPLLPEEKRSPIITSFIFPDMNFSFQRFYDELKKRGFVIYPGKISEQDTFRIGTIGDIDKNDFDKLIKAVGEIEKQSYTNN